MRVPDNMRFQTAILAQQRAGERVQQGSKVASSGLRVAAPSDDPAAYARMTSLDGQISTLDSRTRSATQAAGDLDLAEGTLASASALMDRARELAVQMANGSLTAVQRLDASTEVKGLRDSLLGIANTKGPTGYIFGGSKTDTAPFDATGTFQGNDTALRVEIANGTTVRANASGQDAFTAAAGGKDAFKVLDDFAKALATNNLAGVQASIDEVEGARAQIVGARADTGLMADRFHSALDVMSQSLTTVKSLRADTVEADAPSAYAWLVDAQSAYERSISVARKILSLSSSSGSG